MYINVNIRVYVSQKNFDVGWHKNQILLCMIYVIRCNQVTKYSKTI